jgi:glucokinase
VSAHGSNEQSEANPQMPPWLVSDVGGTNVRFALADLRATAMAVLEAGASLLRGGFFPEMAR